MLVKFQQQAGSPSNMIYESVLINSDRVVKVEPAKLVNTKEPHCDIYLDENNERVTVRGSFEDVSGKLGVGE